MLSQRRAWSIYLAIYSAVKLEGRVTVGDEVQQAIRARRFVVVFRSWAGASCPFSAVVTSVVQLGYSNVVHAWNLLIVDVVCREFSLRFLWTMFFRNRHVPGGCFYVCRVAGTRLEHVRHHPVG